MTHAKDTMLTIMTMVKRELKEILKKGLPVGKLTFYKTDGTKREIKYYDKKGKGSLLKERTMK